MKRYDEKYYFAPRKFRDIFYTTGAKHVRYRDIERRSPFMLDVEVLQSELLEALRG